MDSTIRKYCPVRGLRNTVGSGCNRRKSCQTGRGSMNRMRQKWWMLSLTNSTAGSELSGLRWPVALMKAPKRDTAFARVLSRSSWGLTRSWIQREQASSVSTSETAEWMPNVLRPYIKCEAWNAVTARRAVTTSTSPVSSAGSGSGPLWD